MLTCELCRSRILSAGPTDSLLAVLGNPTDRPSAARRVGSSLLLLAAGLLEPPLLEGLEPAPAVVLFGGRSARRATGAGVARDAGVAAPGMPSSSFAYGRGASRKASRALASAISAAQVSLA